MRWYLLFLLTSIPAFSAVEVTRCFKASNENSSLTLRIMKKSEDVYLIQMDSPDSSGLTIPATIFDRLSFDAPAGINNDVFSWRKGANIVNIQFHGKEESGTVTLRMRSLMNNNDDSELVFDYLKVPCA